MVGGRDALAVQDTTALFIKFQSRANARALLGALLLGSALAVVMGGSYLAGGAARAAMAHARQVRLAAATANGFSEDALRAEVSAMPAGAATIARRHDPFTAAGAAQRDREAALLAQRLERAAPAADPRPPALRASFVHAPVPARPYRLDNPLAGARELDCLSQAVYFEARGESAQGQAAVAQVVLNRVRHPGYPKTICGVVYQGAHNAGCQFSFACDGSIRRSRELVAWKRAQTIAARALSGFVIAEVGDATHFHVARLGGVWGSGLVRVSQVGAHVFYRLTGRTVRPAPGLYAPPAELAEAPVYDEPKAGAAKADAGGASLILAAAVVPATIPAIANSQPGPAPAAPASEPTAKAAEKKSEAPVATAPAAG
jgi:spore germination cell wall hydrolase CwlJ-like protein